MYNRAERARGTLRLMKCPIGAKRITRIFYLMDMILINIVVKNGGEKAVIPSKVLSAGFLCLEGTTLFSKSVEIFARVRMLGRNVSSQ